MSDARWGDPREYGERDRDDERPRVYDERDRDEHDPRDGLMHGLDLPRGDERELVVDRDRVYELGRSSKELSDLRRAIPLAGGPRGALPSADYYRDFSEEGDDFVHLVVRKPSLEGLWPVRSINPRASETLVELFTHNGVEVSPKRMPNGCPTI